MPGAQRSTIDEWREHWTVVLAAVIGISFAAIPIQSMAFFLEPLQRDFGWTRTQVSIGISVFSFVLIPFSPLAGALQDRLGPRRVAIAGVLLCIVALMSLGLTPGSVKVWISQWAFFSLAEMLLKLTVWLAIVSRVFVLGRGLAVAVTLCGTAFAQTVVPLLSYFLIAHIGWRAAYLTLGAGWGSLALLLVLLFFRGPDGRRVRDARDLTAGNESAATLPGLTVREALRCAALYRIALALMLSSAVSIAVITHKVSILNEIGISRAAAAQIAATAGIASVTGKLLTGWLYDRFRSSWIGFVAFALMAVGFLGLLEPLHTRALIVTAMLLFGYSSGAMLQAAMYLTAQYGGLRNFGKIFGVNTSIVSIGIGTGPILGGLIRDHLGSYRPLFALGILIGLLTGLMVSGLGAYPRWETQAQ